MAINEVIVSSYYRRLIDKTAKLWQRMSFWTKSIDVEFNDGKTAEQKVGNIDGITSDFTINNERFAASSSLTKKLHDDMGGVRLGYDENGNPGFIITGEDGADTVRPFSSSGGGLKLLHLRYVIAASNNTPYGSINIQFENVSAKKITVNKNATIYGYSGTGTPSFDNESSQWAIGISKAWEKIKNEDISNYKYIWIRYTFFESWISKKTATFDVQ